MKPWRYTGISSVAPCGLSARSSSARRCSGLRRRFRGADAIRNHEPSFLPLHLLITLGGGGLRLIQRMWPIAQSPQGWQFARLRVIGGVFMNVTVSARRKLAALFLLAAAIVAILLALGRTASPDDKSAGAARGPPTQSSE